VAHHSSDAELRAEPLVRELLAAEANAAFFTCDVRGIGESQPDTCGENQFLKPYGSDYFYAGHSLMLDRPYVGQKTFDLLRVLEWLKSYGHTEIHLAAKGWGALPATFAAVLSDAVAQVTLKQALSSYTAIAESADYDWPLSALLPGVLEKFDLPDCYRVLEPKKLRQLELRGAMQICEQWLACITKFVLRKSGRQLGVRTSCHRHRHTHCWLFAPGPRNIFPAFAPVCCAFSSTTCPLTIT
jgi:hypothetical protein